MTKPPDPSPKNGRARAAKLASWVLGTSLVGAAAAGPALAEAKVQRQLRERLGVDDRFAIDLDLGGLELRGLSRTLPGNRGHVRVDRVRIRPGLDGLKIEIEGLDGSVRRHAPAPKQPKRPDEKSDAKRVPQQPASEPEHDPIADILIKFRGIPIEVVTRGQLSVELTDGLRATARDPKLELPGDGRLLGHAKFEIGSDLDPDWARATLDLAAMDSSPRELQIRGSVALDGDGRRLAITGHTSRKLSSLQLREPEGGSASVTVERNVEPGRDRLQLDAEALPLDLLEPLAQLFGRRLADAIGERDGQIVLDDARISGELELLRGAGLTRAQFDNVELTQVTFDSDLLAPEPVRIDSLTIDGELAREHTPTGPRSFGELVLGHAGVALRISGQLDAQALDFDLELPNTSCQSLLAALPGTSAVLAGTELRGDLDAHFGLHLDFAELAVARERYLGEQAEALELESFDAPGELRFSLPYLERCEVVRRGPGIDIEGLAGPYRHNFVTGSGAEKRRVLALGDRDYVPIDDVPELALAFVILEDARFWEHDGFDREQIERAFWYNILEGRVSRGASTISQQAARSLWLGIDRSVTRKLAEAMLSAELERGLDKQRILEIYLNVIELGPEVHGVAEAARYHFGKEASKLTLVEALHLASMAPAPVHYSRRFADGTIDREWRAHLREQVRRLRIRHLISAKQWAEASKVNLALRRH
ncbi:MAG TPA: biosynthetic peptidoglycan transglycosylase [Enhygromyxa sp.]|nr:biosynthetic peptidoglycan transglycosylase [Enhygromyxa sp.]